jgi:probable rRNA maturation factor
MMIEVEVEDPAWTAALADADSVARRAGEAALEGAPTSAASGGAVTVLLTDDAAVRALNRDFRGKDSATNVLSFPAPDTARPHLGDVALGYGVCAREASDQGKPLEHHLAHLTVHGVLHLLGYDHEADAEAEAMEQLERSVLDRLGVPDPYAADL